MELPYIAFHYIPQHYITLHCITLHYIASWSHTYSMYANHIYLCAINSMTWNVKSCLEKKILFLYFKSPFEILWGSQQGQSLLDCRLVLPQHRSQHRVRGYDHQPVHSTSHSVCGPARISWFSTSSRCILVFHTNKERYALSHGSQQVAIIRNQYMMRDCMWKKAFVETH